MRPFLILVISVSSHLVAQDIQVVDTLISHYVKRANQLATELESVKKLIDSLKIVSLKTQLRSSVTARVRYGGIPLLDEPSLSSRIRGTLDAGSTIRVTDISISQDYFKIIFGNVTRYIPRLASALEESDSVRAFIDQKVEQLDRTSLWTVNLNAYLKADTVPNAFTLASLQQGERVMVLNRCGKWYQVRTDFQMGWMTRKDLSSDYTEQLSLTEYRRRSFIEGHPNINPTFKAAIIAGKIQIGMSKEMVLASWGYPSDINRTVTSTLVREQWIYGRIYVYFENGVLTAWQD